MALAFYFLLMIPMFVMSLVLHGRDCLFLKEKKIASFFIAAPILVFATLYIGLRSLDSGGDTIHYVAAFNRVDSIIHATFDAQYGSEILFWPTQAILKLLLDHQTWVIANFLIILLLCIYAYNAITKDTEFGVLLFSMLFLSYYSVYTGNVLRQVYAAPLIAAAFHSACNRRIMKSAFLLALAIGYHWSAIAFCFAFLVIIMPNKKSIYYGMPLAGLCVAALVPYFSDFVINNIPNAWIGEKVNLYVFGKDQTHHVGEVWQLFNFWICAGVYFLALIFKIYRERTGIFLMKYMGAIIFIMLAGINYVDISERYMAYFMFIVPLALACILKRIKAPIFLKNILFLSGFYSLGVATFYRPTAQWTLGIS